MTKPTRRALPKRHKEFRDFFRSECERVGEDIGARPPTGSAFAVISDEIHLTLEGPFTGFKTTQIQLKLDDGAIKAKITDFVYTTLMFSAVERGVAESPSFEGVKRLRVLWPKAHGEVSWIRPPYQTTRDDENFGEVSLSSVKTNGDKTTITCKTDDGTQVIFICCHHAEFEADGLTPAWFQYLKKKKVTTPKPSYTVITIPHT